MACDIPTAGEVICDEALVDQQVIVRQYDDAATEPTGWLHIRANTITIAEGALIDATGKGHRTAPMGTAWGNGEGDGGGNRGAQAVAGAAAPGGGGGHLGTGGFGIESLTGCLVSISAAGGSSYDDVSAPLALVDPVGGLGSAGGASFCGDTSDQVRAGGRGGGVVLLTAARIILHGAIHADGEGLDELGGTFGGCGPGAGAGGTIVIATHELELGPAAVLSARGGRGIVTLDAQGMDASNSWGGGGGGGLIAIVADGAPSPVGADVTGGAAACAGGDGQPGAFTVGTPAACVDADGDGHGSRTCGGDDCDDGAPEVHPGAIEVCDADDNDCDGSTDNAGEASPICPAGSGHICHDGLCIPGNAAEPLPAPGVPEIELGGGLCSSSVRGPRGRGSLGALLTLALGFLIRGSRRRPA